MLEQTTVMTIVQYIDSEIAKRESTISCAAIERDQLMDTRATITAMAGQRAIKTACQCCHQTMSRNKSPLEEKWTTRMTGYSHGICLDCLRGIDAHGYDKWLELTEGKRQ